MPEFSGTWSATYVPSEVGTFSLDGLCLVVPAPDVPEVMTDQVSPDDFVLFEYPIVELQVIADPTTTTTAIATTSTGVSTTTTTVRGAVAADAVAATPAFTG